MRSFFEIRSNRSDLFGKFSGPVPDFSDNLWFVTGKQVAAFLSTSKSFRQKTDEGPAIILHLVSKRNGGGQDMAARRIKKEIRDRIVTILKKYDAERIAIFGSYARGEAGRKSDIDILVRFARPKSLIQLVQIEDEITKAVKVPVDLVTEKSVSPYLSPSIHRDEVVIYG